MKIRLIHLLNPRKIFQAIQYARQQRKYDRSAYDLELHLYASMLRNDMLHYGYFEDPAVCANAISLKDMEAAQVRYAENIIRAANDLPGKAVLDAGCGMGGLSAMLKQAGFQVEALTPNDRQVEYIGKKFPSLSCHHTRYEDFETAARFDAVIHSESLQYIPLEAAFSKTDQFVVAGGKWIISDYFRIDPLGRNTSGHLLEEFLEKVRQYDWKITQQSDMTAHVLPTLRLVRLYADRFGLPLKHFALEKLRFKKPFWYFMTDELRASMDEKVERELSAIDPELFAREKKYMLFVLQKKASHE